MKKFKYEISIPAQSQAEADEKMQLALAIVNKLTADEAQKLKAIINNPEKFAIAKQYL